MNPGPRQSSNLTLAVMTLALTTSENQTRIYGHLSTHNSITFSIFHHVRCKGFDFS